MSLDYVKFSPGFEAYMPKEYRDMVEHGPFGKKTTVSQMGSFKEILEEHPMCAGCAMTLFIRLAIIAFPNPEDTITVGTAAGSHSLRLRQLWRPKRRRQRLVAWIENPVWGSAQRCRRDGR
jgi:hypothetical protein